MNVPTEEMKLCDKLVRDDSRGVWLRVNILQKIAHFSRQREREHLSTDCNKQLIKSRP